MEKIKVSFFFGAGAEADGNFNLPTGFEFMRKTMFNETYLKNVCDALGEYFNKEYFKDNINNKNYKYYKVKSQPYKAILKNIIFYKAYNDDSFQNKEKEIIKYVLPNSMLKDIYLNESNIKKEYSEKINNKYKIIEEQFKKVLNEEITDYYSIDPFLQNIFCNEDKKIVYNDNISVAGILEKNFFTIVDPVKHGKFRFSCVFNYYWLCYFVIVYEIIIHNRKEFEKILSNIPVKKSISKDFYLDILNNITEVTEKLYEFTPSTQENTYYKLIKELFDNDPLKNNFEINSIVTTNYLNLCKLCGVEEKNIINLNGEFKYFEFPEHMEILPYNELENKKYENLFFPFIFGQSYLKPIVNSLQIKAFHKFYEALNDTDILVILGYNINEDDNHINTFLHDYIKYGKKTLIYVTNDNAASNLFQKLKIKSEKIKICKVNYKKRNSYIIEKIREEIYTECAINS